MSEASEKEVKINYPMRFVKLPNQIYEVFDAENSAEEAEEEEVKKEEVKKKAIKKEEAEEETAEEQTAEKEAAKEKTDIQAEKEDVQKGEEISEKNAVFTTGSEQKEVVPQSGKVRLKTDVPTAKDVEFQGKHAKNYKNQELLDQALGTRLRHEKSDTG